VSTAGNDLTVRGMLVVGDLPYRISTGDTFQVNSSDLLGGGDLKLGGGTLTLGGGVGSQGLLNASFEDPPFDMGIQYVTVPVTSWQQSMNATEANPIRHHPITSGWYAAPTDGDTILGMESTFDGSITSGAQQDLGTMIPREQYTFTGTLFGQRDWPAGYVISFYNVDDGVDLVAITQDDFPVSGVQTVAASMSYTALASDAGDTLRLILDPLPEVNQHTRVGIDSVAVMTASGGEFNTNLNLLVTAGSTLATPFPSETAIGDLTLADGVTLGWQISQGVAASVVARLSADLCSA